MRDHERAAAHILRNVDAAGVLVVDAAGAIDWPELEARFHLLSTGEQAVASFAAAIGGNSWRLHGTDEVARLVAHVDDDCLQRLGEALLILAGER